MADRRRGLAEVVLEFLERRLAKAIEGQHEIVARLAEIATTLEALRRPSPGSTARDPVERLLQAYTDGTDPAEATVDVLRELLDARVQAANRARAALHDR